MKKNYFTLAACTLLILFTVSCTSTEIRKKDAETARNLGEGHMSQGNYTAALNELLKAQRLTPDDPFLHNDLGLTYMEKGKLDLSVEHFKKALKFNPGFAAAKNNLGMAYLKKSEWDAAIACFKDVTENMLYTTPQNAFLNLGVAYYYKKEYAASEKYYQDCLNYYREGLQPDATYVNALYGLGQIYIASGRIPEAVIVLEKAIKIAPRVSYLHYYLARAYVLSKDYQNAMKAYSKVVEIAPETAMGQEANKTLLQLKSQNKQGN